MNTTIATSEYFLYHIGIGDNFFSALFVKAQNVSTLLLTSTFHFVGYVQVLQPPPTFFLRNSDVNCHPLLLAFWTITALDQAHCSATYCTHYVLLFTKLDSFPSLKCFVFMAKDQVLTLCKTSLNLCTCPCLGDGTACPKILLTTFYCFLLPYYPYD